MQLARSTLPEAQFVLTELNHRFMNSLQMMASLTRTRSGAAPAQQLARLHDCISAYGRMHGVLAARTAPPVELGCDEICNALVTASGRQAFWTVAIEDEPSDHALRLGILLVITELVTNAFKHASADETTLAVELVRDYGLWRLRVESANEGRSSLPHIADALTRWLGGELSVDCTAGYTVCASFPDQPTKVALCSACMISQ